MAATIAMRALQPEDLHSAHALSAGFGWPHRLEDWRFMLACGSGIAAEHDGTLLGTGMSWTFGADAAAIGMIAVAPQAQGRGLGRRIVERILQRLGSRRVLLHATEAGLPLYRSLGFEAGGLVRQHQGVPAAVDPTLAAPRRMTHSDGPALLALDRAATGMDRARLLAALLREAECVMLDQGFALLRRFGRGHVIGPVVAPDAAQAKALIGHLLASRPGAFMRIDVPETSGLGPWLASIGLADVGPAVRMVRGTPLQAGGTFALISQAFG